MFATIKTFAILITLYDTHRKSVYTVCALHTEKKSPREILKNDEYYKDFKVLEKEYMKIDLCVDLTIHGASNDIINALKATVEARSTNEISDWII